MKSIKDVAALAGVSFTTVSHVLNETRHVSEETRRKVMAAVEQLGYRPNAGARMMRKSGSKLVGVLVPTVLNPFFAELVVGIEERCRLAGYSVFLCNSDDTPELQHQYLSRLLEYRVDGLLISSAKEDETLVGMVNAASLPVVTMNHAFPGLKADMVSENNREGARLAVGHLLELGHRRIACISGPAGLEFARERTEGWRSMLRDAGIVPNEDLLVEGDFSSQGGYEAACRLLHNFEDGQAPTAIFAGNDMMAIGALRAAAELGLNVPKQLSIIGFDDIDLSRYVSPALTTVGCSIKKLGNEAARVLIERIAQPDAPHNEVVMTHFLALRDSTAPPPRQRKGAG